MSMYFPGYEEAKQNVAKMNLDELLSLLDDLYGRSGLKYGDTVDDVRTEAFKQLREEWTDKSSREYESFQFSKRFIEAIR